MRDTAEEDFARAMTAHAERRKRRRRWVISAVLLLAFVITALTSVLWIRSEQAEQQAREEALRAEAAKLLALAQLEPERDPTEALAYATVPSAAINATPASSIIVPSVTHLVDACRRL